MGATVERFNPVNLRVSDAYLAQTGDEEGFVGYAYDDADPKAIKTFITEDNKHLVQGTLTIGHGHTRTVRPGMRITREEAKSLLRSDVRDAESCVHRFVRVPLTQGEFDGLTDLFFNVGPGSMPNEHYPNGKDGIACLGRSGKGRQSTLLTILNSPDEKGTNYERAATCFTQWRQPGSIFEWGLLKRRIRFMLFFLGLPLTRAVNAFPNAPPLNDTARYNLVQSSVALAREEAADSAFLKPAPLEATIDGVKQKAEAELVLNTPAAPLATDAKGTEPVQSPQPTVQAPSPVSDPVRASRDAALPPKDATELPSGPEGSKAPPVAPSVSAPAPQTGAAAGVKPAPAEPPLAPLPPPKPIVIAPKSIDIKAIPYGEIDPVNPPATNMSDSRRVLGMVIVGAGSLVQILAAREVVSSSVGAIFFDMSRDPVVVALIAGGAMWIVGWLTRKRGTQIVTKGMSEARSVLK